MAGSRAEFEHRLEDARLLYQQAWEARTDDYNTLSDTRADRERDARML